MRRRNGKPVAMGKSTNQLQLQVEDTPSEGKAVWSSLML